MRWQVLLLLHHDVVTHHQLLMLQFQLHLLLLMQLNFIEAIGQFLFLLLHFIRRSDYFLAVLKETLNEFKFVESQQFKEVVLQRVVGFRREKKLLQRGGHFRRRKTGSAVFPDVGVQRGDLTSEPEKVKGVATARAAGILIEYVDGICRYVEEVIEWYAWIYINFIW